MTIAMCFRQVKKKIRPGRGEPAGAKTTLIS